MLEIESTKIESENKDQREKRKSFYLRNGMKDAGISVVLFGVTMELLTCGGDISFDDYYKVYKDVFGKVVSNNIKPA